ncbi:hypothetical protein V6N11_025792 [Hibiscus sabdariffa]|uniref:Uncharacterized protein n=1 Tax=Hibiscus sabdariffa TaxID=183260 RepID=A0ABR2SUD9_9ROSI
MGFSSTKKPSQDCFELEPISVIPHQHDRVDDGLHIPVQPDLLNGEQELLLHLNRPVLHFLLYWLFRQQIKLYHLVIPQFLVVWCHYHALLWLIKREAILKRLLQLPMLMALMRVCLEHFSASAPPLSALADNTTPAAPEEASSISNLVRNVHSMAWGMSMNYRNLVAILLIDDEAEHCKTMKACQTRGNLGSPHSYEMALKTFLIA